MEKMLIINAEQCISCKVCELMCSMAKHGEYNPKKSYIRILRNKDLDVSIPVLRIECDYCGKCVEYCPTDALRIVTLQEAAIIRKKSTLGTFPLPLLDRTIT